MTTMFRARIIIFAIAMAVTLSILAPVVASEAPARADYTFSSIGSWKAHAIDVDQTTMFSMIDDDDDVQIGAVFRITLVEPAAPAGTNTKVKTVISAVVAVCGYDGVVVLNSKAFDTKGTLVLQRNEIQSFMDPKIPSHPMSEIYAFLCKNVTTQPRGNNYT